MRQREKEFVGAIQISTYPHIRVCKRSIAVYIHMREFVSAMHISTYPHKRVRERSIAIHLHVREFVSAINISTSESSLLIISTREREKKERDREGGKV